MKKINQQLGEQELRQLAAGALAETCPARKCERVQALGLDLPVNAVKQLVANMGRPVRPELVPPRQVPARSVQLPQGRGMLLHALAHIEFNAINLALDAMVRFADMPDQFYRDWAKVAREEALHHTLLVQRLHDYQLAYGDCPAHDGLWQMAEKTSDSLLARLALVPRLLEARGLDVSPAIRDKLHAAGDTASAEVLDIILRDEIGHVHIGNHWFHVLCTQQCLEPIATFERCLADYRAPEPRPPFNYAARQQAGFTEQEIQWLYQLDFAPQTEPQ
ncbi:MAG: ferritin-like domain-containing protein [Limnobacter sp.]|nr:ferritin-like domain-containing protein [Limnobacter sp.]